MCCASLYSASLSVATGKNPCYSSVSQNGFIFILHEDFLGYPGPSYLYNVPVKNKA